MCQLARVGEKQQAFRVDVKAPNRLPLALRQTRQAPVHGGAVLRVIVGDDFADRLVVGDQARRWRRDVHLDDFAVDLDLVAQRNALAYVRRFAVHRDAPVQDHVFHVAPRAHPGLRQHLVQLRRLRIRGEDALVRFDLAWRGGVCVDYHRFIGTLRHHTCWHLVGVERTGQHLRKQFAGLSHCGLNARRCIKLSALCAVGRGLAHGIAAVTPLAVTPISAPPARPVVFVSNLTGRSRRCVDFLSKFDVATSLIPLGG